MAKRKSNIRGTSRKSTKSTKASTSKETTKAQVEETTRSQESAKDISEEMMEQIKLATNLKKLYDEIEKIELKLSDLKKGGKKNLQEINLLFKERLKLQQEIIASEEKIKKLREDAKKDQKTTEKSQKDTKKHEEESEKRQEKNKENRKKIKKQQEEYKKTEEEIRKLQHEMNVEMSLTDKMMQMLGGNAAEFANQVKITNSLYDYQTKVVAQVPNLLKEQNGLSNEFVGILDKSKAVSEDIRRLEIDINKQVDDASIGKYNNIDTSKLELDLARKRLSIESNLSQMSEKEKKVALDLLSHEEDALSALKKKDKMLSDMSKKAVKTASIIEKLTRGDLKGGIREMFSSKDSSAEMGKAVTDTTKKIRSEKGIKGALEDAAKSFGSKLKSAFKFISAAAITGLIRLTKFIWNNLASADEEAAQLGKDFILSRQDAGKLNLITRELADQMRIVGIHSKEIVEGIKVAGDVFEGVGVAEQLLKGNKQMETFVQQSAILAKNFGLSSEEIGNIKDLSTVTNVPMDILVKQSDLLGKNTMGTKQSLKALAKIPKEVAIGFKGSTKELLAAAQKAKLLGMELKDIRDIGIKMLDIESSLESEMEARVLTGKDLNLDAARYYGLQGDVFHLQDELLYQVGSLEDFQRMNVIQQESLATAVGMTVEQLGKVLTNAKKLKDADISPDYAESLSQLKSAEELEAELTRQRKAGAKQAKLDYIQQLANDKRSASIKERFVDLLDKIKAKFQPVLETILEFAHRWFDAAEATGLIDKILDGIKAVIPKIVGFIRGFLGAITNFFSNFDEFMPKVEKFGASMATMGSEFWTKYGEKLSFMLEVLKEMSGIIWGFLKWLGPFNAAIAILAFKLVGPQGIAKGIGFLAKKGYEKITDKKPKLPDSDGGGGTRGSRGRGGLADFMNKSKPKNILATGAALIMLSIALYITAKAFQEFAQVPWSGVAKGILALGALVTAAKFMSKITKDIRKAAFSIVILAGALYVAAKAFQQFATVDWDDLAKGVLALGALAGVLYLMSKVIKGKGATDLIKIGLALILVGAAVWVLGEALQKFEKIKFTDVLLAVGAVYGLGMAAKFLGANIVEIGLGALAIAAIGVAVWLLGWGLQKLMPLFELFVDYMKFLIKVVKEVVLNIIHAIKDILIKVVEKAAAILKNVFKGISLVIKSFGEVVVNVMKTIAQTISTTLTAISKTITTIVKGIADGITSILNGLKNIITGIAGAIATTVERIGKAFSDTANGISTALLRLQPLVESVFNGIERVINASANAIVTVVNAIIDAIGRLVAMIERLSNMDGKRLSNVADGVGSISLALAKFGAGGGVGAAVEGVGGKIGKLFGSNGPLENISQFQNKIVPSTLNTISNAIVYLANSIKYFVDQLNRINSSTTQSAIESFGKIKVPSSSSLPKRAAGGLSSGLTVVGEEGPEIVNLPRNSMVVSNDVSGQIMSTLNSVFPETTRVQSQGSQTVSPVMNTTVATVTSPQSNRASDTTNLEKKLDTLISVMTSAVTQPTVIKIGERTVEEIGTSLDFKKNYNIAVDTGYGKVLR